MDILHLNYFLAVAHHKSFTKASQALHISQPSISKNIRNLEAEWGVTLFNRNGRVVELTDVGQSLLPKIKAIVSQFQQLNQQIHDKEAWEYGHLTIGVPPMVGSTFLAPLLSEFTRRYPHITIAVEEHGSNNISKSIIDGSLQVGYIALPIASIPKNNYIFHDEPLQVLLPKKHPLGKREKLSLEDIKDEPFAFFTEEFSLYQTVVNHFQNIGVRPNIVCKSLNWDFISELVHSDVGVALLPASICKRLLKRSFNVVDLEPNISWRVSMVWGHDIFISNASTLWIEFFKEKMKEMQHQNLQ